MRRVLCALLVLPLSSTLFFACGRATQGTCAELADCPDPVIEVEGGPALTDDSGTDSAAPPTDADASDASLDAFEASCATEQPDFDDGVFVVPTGTDAGGSLADAAAGSPGNPCASIGACLTLAAAQEKRIVYVAYGNYVETLTLASGITIQGGWTVAAGAWSHVCTGSPSSLAVIQAPASANQTVVASDLASDAGATLATLTILSKDQAKAGETLYGVFATGASTQLTLQDVVIQVGAGGNGGGGGTGTSASPPGSCSYSSSGNGNNGASVGNASGASAGSFTASGFVASNGTQGPTGNPGSNGTAGGTTCTDNCLSSGGTCNAIANNECAASATFSSCGTGGVGGCGGAGGGGGQGGAGGGSSIGVFASGATVTLLGGSVQAGPGGTGGSGGGGGHGASGGAGAGGSAGPACTLCPAMQSLQDPGNCNGTSSATPGSGNQGNQGGTGSAGGQGGGGAGGDSYALYAFGGATLSVVGTTLAHGDGGVSLGNGASGVGAAQGP